MHRAQCKITLNVYLGSRITSNDSLRSQSLVHTSLLSEVGHRSNLSIRPNPDGRINQQQYQLFPLPWFGLVGLKSGTGEPVLGHKGCGNVSLVVNNHCCFSMKYWETGDIYPTPLQYWNYCNTPAHWACLIASMLGSTTDLFSFIFMVQMLLPILPF